jgi:hypothetical protein
MQMVSPMKAQAARLCFTYGMKLPSATVTTLHQAISFALMKKQQLALLFEAEKQSAARRPVDAFGNERVNFQTWKERTSKFRRHVRVSPTSLQKLEIQQKH